MKFTRDKAIWICQKKLTNKISSVEAHCMQCYYYDGGCELGYKVDYVRDCVYYLDDVSFTNTVRENILKNPERIKERWDELCSVDKELFIAIYGDMI